MLKVEMEDSTKKEELEGEVLKFLENVNEGSMGLSKYIYGANLFKKAWC